MCGLVGYSSKSNFNLDKIKLLLTYNTLERGSDSLGFYSPTNGLYKKSDKPIELIPKIEFKDDNYFIGHVRSATVGNKSDKNAHPFQFNELIGVMNGTTINHWSLTTKYGLKTCDYDVDSEAIFAIIQKQQNFKVLGELNGGCAILTADTRNPNVLYAYRNNDRPLFRGNIGDSMYISSIEESLKIIDCDKVQEFKPNNVYTIIDGEITNTSYIKVQTYSTSNDLDISGESTININKLENIHFVGRWLRFDSPNSYVAGNFTDGDWYYCLGKSKDNSYQIVVRDNNKKVTEVAYRLFSWSLSFPIKNSPMKILRDIVYGKKNKVVIKEGEILPLIKYTKDNIHILKKLDNGNSETWMIDFRSARPLDYQETLEWEKENKSKSENNTSNTDTSNIINQNNIDENWEQWLKEQGIVNEDNQCDILNPPRIIENRDKKAAVQWLDQFKKWGNKNQLQLPLNKDDSKVDSETEIVPDEKEDLDDEFVSITHKELKELFDNLKFGLDNLLIDVNAKVYFQRDKRTFTETINEITSFLDQNESKYLGV